MAIVYGDSIKGLCARVAARICEQLELGKVPWQCPFERRASSPFNVVRRVRDGHKGVYSGINNFLLTMTMWEHGWESPAFLTMTQLKALNPGKDPDGPRLKRVDNGIPLSPDDWRDHGQQAAFVVVFKEGKPRLVDGKEERSYFGRTYAVYNVAQVANLPADILDAAAVASGDWKPECVPAEIMAAIEGLKLAGGVIAADQPHYNSKTDAIGMAPFARFVSEDAYLATILHEAGHAAGHPSRVGREPKEGHTRKEALAAYAREELCAELTSAMSMAAFGLPPTQELQHVGYLQSYLELLKADPAVLVWAASQAEKRTSHLVEKAREIALLSAAAAAAD